ncbi:MAG: pyruvate kinase, partial [Chitinophagales bacterium]
ESQLAEQPDTIREMLLAGMQVARINCAHDNPDIWLKMIRNTKAMSKSTKRPCKIYIDLAGPKIRTCIAGKGRKKGRMKVQQDDTIYLTDDTTFDDENLKIVQCTLKGIILQLQTGNRVFFDDGKIATKVIQVENNTATLLVTRCRDGATKLANEKGINFPDTELNVMPLTDYDKKCIPFAAQYGDLLGYSFVRNASDIRLLKKEIRKSGNKIPHLVLKIETLQAVNNLPMLLLEGMKENYFGVMIARGDLALEIGFERLSEIQEEILWICEAAHTPVIWATQVLESLNKSGLPTRAEITDASHASFAECVMLNKGIYMREVLESLHSILQRTGSHRLKKRYIFRSLSIAENFVRKFF